MISSTDWRWRPYPADAYDPPENDGGGVVRATGARRGDSTTALLTAAALAAGATATALGGVPVVAAGPAVVINELNYNPVDDNPAGEYVELYNRSGATVDIGGWCVDGIDYCYPAGATIAAGGYFAVWGAWFGGALSNGGEEIVLLDADGEVVDAVEYDDHGEWPALADGDGHTLQRRSADGPSGHPGNWQSALPTPGAPNAVSGGLLPTFTDVEHDESPAAGAPIHVTAGLDGASSATLVYRVGDGPETTVTMTLSGGSVSATIPGQAAGALVRYRLSARRDGRTGTWPRQGDGANYAGLLVAAPARSALPTFQLFMPADTYETMVRDLTLTGDDGYPVTVAFDGQVFDNARIRVKGQSSRGWVKKKFKVILPPGYELEHELFPEAIDEWALHSSWSDRSFLRETLASELMTAAGSRALQAFPARLELNGDFYGLYTYSEQPDGSYRDRYGLDESVVYEVGPDRIYGMLAPEDVTRPQDQLRARYDKETFEYLDDQQLRDFIWVVNQLSGAAEREWIYANVDVPSVVNAIAASMVIQQQDWGVKNYRLVFDPRGRVGVTQNDFDLSWGRRWSMAVHGLDTQVYVGGAWEQPGGPFFETFMYDAELYSMIARRVRTLAEELLVPGDVAARIDALYAQIAPDAGLDRQKWGTYGGAADPAAEAWRIVADYVRPQYSRILGALVARGRVAATSQPAVPAIGIDAVVYDGVQQVVLRNWSGDTVDLSGFTIPELDVTVPGGTVLLSGRSAVLVHEDATRTAGAFPGHLVAGVFDESLDDAERGFRLLNRQGAVVAAHSAVPPGSLTELDGHAGRSAFVSVVSTENRAASFLQVLDCDARPGTTSNVNADGPGQIRAGLALARFDGVGAACVYNHAAGHVVADLKGYVAEGAVDDVDDVRLVDTRAGARPGAGAVVRLTGRPEATGLVNLTATDTAGPGLLAVVDCADPRVVTSDLNYDHARATVASLAAVRFGADGEACVVTSAAAHVVADLQAYLAAAAFDDVPNQRLVDTRAGTRPGDGARTELRGRPGATALVSVVATDSVAPGFVQALACDAAAGATSDVNYDRAGPVIVNTLTVVAFDADGSACLYTSVGVHLVADLQGYFADGTFQAVAARLVDTRR